MKSDKMAEDIANPGSALGEAIGALLEKEIHRILKPLAEESGCIYVTAGPVNPKTGKVTKLILTDGDGNEYNVDSVIINSWSKSSKRLLRSFEVELFEISFNDICDALSPYQIDYRWAEKDRRQAMESWRKFCQLPEQDRERIAMEAFDEKRDLDTSSAPALLME